MKHATMDGFKTALFLAITILLIQDIASHTLEMGPITWEPSCGLENKKGGWEVEGNLTFTEWDDGEYELKLIMRTIVYNDLCDIDLTDCPPSVLPTSDDACYCSGKILSSVLDVEAYTIYQLYVRRGSRTAESQMMLQAALPYQFTWYNEYYIQDIGRLPLVYKSRAHLIPTYQVNEEVPRHLSHEQNVLIADDEYTVIRVCVLNLQSESLIKAVIGDVEIRTKEPCLDIHGFYDFDGVDEYIIEVFYEEEAVCARDRKSTLTLKKPLGTSLGQWVHSIIAVSSEGTDSGSGYLATNLLGIPDFYPAYGDSPLTWSVLDYLIPPHWVELQFPTPVTPFGIDIYETFNAGSVVAVKALNSAGAWVTLWSAPSPEDLQYTRIFSPPLGELGETTNAIRLELDMTAADDWCELDSIMLYGW